MQRCNEACSLCAHPVLPSEIEALHDASVGIFAGLVAELSLEESNPLVRQLALTVDKAFDVAKRSVRCANGVIKDLRAIHRVARIGNWRTVLDSRSMTWSDELHVLFDTDPREFVPSLDALTQKLIPADRATFTETFGTVIARKTNLAIEVRSRTRDQSMRWFWIEMQPESDDAGTVFAVRGICQEITERKAAIARIRYAASHDPVTGLINRPHLVERLELVLAEAERRRENVALLRFDVDGFNGVNDLFGNAVGNDVLREVASRMLRQVRDGDIVAHIGGDEFVVIQSGGLQPDSAEALARRLLTAIAAPMEFRGHPEIAVSASVGIAIHPLDGTSPDLLMTNSNHALHSGRSQCGNSLVFYHPSMEAEWQERRSLEQSLRLALPNGEFSLAYQPMFCMSTRRCNGFEALLRWNSPVHGAVPPDMFIGIAESIGLMEELGAWVLRQACAEAVHWFAPLSVAVNVSPLQIEQGNLVGVIAEALAATGLAPERLEIEVTETLLISSPDHAVDTLRRIRAMGVRVAIDDFGTGYSSLATLRAFPFDKLKVDRSFVRDLGEASDSLAIINAVLGLGRGLQLPVVVEGVETERQARILRDCGADVIQGYLVGRPLPIASFGEITDSTAELDLPGPPLAAHPARLAAIPLPGP